MPTDTASATVVVDAPLEEVLATIRDVDGIPGWVSDIIEAEVLTTTEDGMPLTARFAASTPVGTDRYTLAYEHSPDGLSWHLVKGRLQTAQDATYTLDVNDPTKARGATSLTFRFRATLTQNGETYMVNQKNPPVSVRYLLTVTDAKEPVVWQRVS